MPVRSPQQVQEEIEQARDQLASSIDSLVGRVSPKRLANDAKQSVVEKAQTPVGKAVVGGVGLLVALLVVRRIRGGSSD